MNEDEDAESNPNIRNPAVRGAAEACSTKGICLAQVNAANAKHVPPSGTGERPRFSRESQGAPFQPATGR